MKIYAIKWGFYSSSDGYEEYGPFWSTRDKAMKYLMNEVKQRNLEQRISKKTGQLLDIWTDGDYYITSQEIELDQNDI